MKNLNELTDRELIESYKNDYNLSDHDCGNLTQEIISRFESKVEEVKQLEAFALLVHLMRVRQVNGLSTLGQLERLEKDVDAWLKKRIISIPPFPQHTLP